MSFFENTRKSLGLGGKLMVMMMNIGHRALAGWGLQFLSIAPDAKVLDCGCGGGANIKTLLKKCPQGIVNGIDYSDVSVEWARKLNQSAIACGAARCSRAMCRSLASRGAVRPCHGVRDGLFLAGGSRAASERCSGFSNRAERSSSATRAAATPIRTINGRK